MKFLVVKNINEDKNFKPLLGGLLLFMLFYLFVNIFLKHYSIGILPLDLANNFLGNEQTYLDPMELHVFLEFWHMDIFFMMMILLTLSAVYMRINKYSKLTLLTTHINLLSAFIYLSSLAMSYFFISWFVYLSFVSFVIWHLLSVYMTSISLYKLYFA